MVFIAVLAEIAHGKAVHDPGHALKELLGQLLFILHLLPRLPLSVQPGFHADDEDRDRCHQQHGKEDHQDQDRHPFYLLHAGIHDRAVDCADDRPVLDPHRFIHQIVFRPPVDTHGAPALRFCDVLLQSALLLLRHHCLRLQKCKQILHTLGKFRLRLQRKQDTAIHSRDIAVAFSIEDHFSQQPFHDVVIVAHRNACVGNAIQREGLAERNGKHDLSQAAGGDIGRDTRFLLLIQFQKRTADVVLRPLAASSRQELAVLVEQVEVAVLPEILSLDQLLPKGCNVFLLRDRLQITVPVGQHVPAALCKQRECFCHLVIGFQQVVGAFLVDLILNIILIRNGSD